MGPVMKLLGTLVVNKTATEKRGAKGWHFHLNSTLRFAFRLNTTEYSSLRARYITLLIFSATHTCFFIIMGSRLGLRGLLSAYAISSFSRAFLTGKSTNYHTFYLPR